MHLEFMVDHPDLISALRVSNEAFLVASTIERCPKTMMLRELVTNALEAAGQTNDGVRSVSIHGVPVDGHNKLAILNTGPGLSADELHTICDLASTLHKRTALDGNFGMGAKVASLPSNKHGLRFRSCKAGVVSQVTLGQRGGAYGRLIQRLPSGRSATCVDVTEQCQSEGRYDLSRDWTEVLLLGNRADQDTVRAPYDNDPPVSQRWIADYLCNRFYRIPGDIAVRVEDGGASWEFRGYANRSSLFDQSQSVATEAGFVVHYNFSASTSPEAPDGLPHPAGSIAIVWRDELYGLRAGQDWVVDAPSFGVPFGAGHVAIFIELPPAFAVRPEVYRQFLRYQDGDQRQVLVADLAALVRLAMPEWLRDIIASFGPKPVDYTAAVTDDLRDLLIELGVAPVSRGVRLPRGSQSEVPEPATREASLPRTSYETPPEIIPLRDPAQIDERDLQGRAARYYPAPHQLFVNLTYASVTRAAMQLEQIFEGAPDQLSRKQVADELAEWMLALQVGRGLVFALAKRDAGWQSDAVARASSPETFSVIADGFAGLMPVARDRMAERLGMEPLMAAGSALSARSAADIRTAAELVDAQQAARRALKTPGIVATHLLTRVSTIHQQRGDMNAALDWAQRAVDAAPQDPWAYHHLSGLRVQVRDFDGAETAVRVALELSAQPMGPILRQAATVAQQRGDTAAALMWNQRALEVGPRDAWNHHQRSSLLLQQLDLDGAEASARAAIELEQSRPAVVMRQLGAVLAQRRDLAGALDMVRRAVEADPRDAWNYHQLASLLIQCRDLDGAERAQRLALDHVIGPAASIIRQMSSIRAKQQDHGGAVEWIEKALEADPRDVWNYHELSALLASRGELDSAEQAISQGLSLTSSPPAPLLRQLSSIQQRRGDLTAALETAHRAIAAAEADPWNYHHLSSLIAQKDPALAEDAARRAVALAPTPSSAMIRQLSVVQAQRGDVEAALATARQAVAADAADPWNHHHISGLLMQQGRLDEAEEAIRSALGDDTAEGDSPLVRRLAAIERERERV
jgi:tetratricopeptide (TPR) repeat protein